MPIDGPKKRPSPQKLLELLEKQGRVQQGNTGLLKIYLGYAAGVGKTYRMLKAALAQREAGREIVIGIVETHGRDDILRLVPEFESVPLLRSTHGGLTVEELDLDAILRRKPDTVIIDELAHTNRGDVRHRKRWQDVEELLAAGINVHTTLNVQHVEGLHDLIAQITGIDVQETLPDRIIEEADDIEIVDLPPEELVQRLRAGKIYVPEQAKEATRNFFTERNLLALRELALRYVSRQVGNAVGRYLADNDITGPWDSSGRIMVCVTADPLSGKLLRVGRRLAGALNAEWIAVHVDVLSASERSVEEKVLLEQHLELARELGATIVRQSGLGMADEISALAQARNVSIIVVGRSRRQGWSRLLRPPLAASLLRRRVPAQVLAVDDGSTARSDPPVTGLGAKKSPFSLRSLALSAAGLMATTIMCLLLRPVLNPLNVAMIYLLFVACSSVILDLRTGLFFAALSVAVFNFFFIPPYLSFNIHDLEYIPSFSIMFLVGASTNFLTEIIKKQVQRSKEREAFMSHLYDFSATLLTAQTFGEVLESAVRGINGVFDCDAIFLLPDAQGELTHLYTPDALTMTEHERGIATWALRNKQPAGLGTDTLSGGTWHHLPLAVAGKSLGVLSIAPHGGDFGKDRQRLLQAHVNIIALALFNSRTAPMPDLPPG